MRTVPDHVTLDNWVLSAAHTTSDFHATKELLKCKQRTRTGREFYSQHWVNHRYIQVDFLQDLIVSRLMEAKNRDALKTSCSVEKPKAEYDDKDNKGNHASLSSSKEFRAY